MQDDAGALEGCCLLGCGLLGFLSDLRCLFSARTKGGRKKERRKEIEQQKATNGKQREEGEEKTKTGTNRDVDLQRRGQKRRTRPSSGTNALTEKVARTENKEGTKAQKNAGDWLTHLEEIAQQRPSVTDS